jgi:hypothetical protein
MVVDDAWQGPLIGCFAGVPRMSSQDTHFVAMSSNNCRDFPEPHGAPLKHHKIVKRLRYDQDQALMLSYPSLCLIRDV